MPQTKPKVPTLGMHTAHEALCAEEVRILLTENGHTRERDAVDRHVLDVIDGAHGAPRICRTDPLVLLVKNAQQTDSLVRERVHNIGAHPRC